MVQIVHFLNVIYTHFALHHITLPYITLHYITLHYLTLHYITSHYITLHYTGFKLALLQSLYVATGRFMPAVMLVVTPDLHRSLKSVTTF
jgi:hypothetical protein